MPTISASAVSSLRARTGVSILACKDALEEAGGDEEKAIEILRKRGIAQAAKKASREQSEGLIFIAEEGNRAAAVVLKCETDFVSRDATFQDAGSKLAQEVLTKGLGAAEALAATLVPELVQKLGENITTSDMHLFEHPVVGAYLHSNAKVAVVIGLNGGTRDMARDVAMHATAMSPVVVRPEDISEDLVEKEKEIWREQLKKEGKPEAMFDKIMIGKEKKFREESALTKQPFVKDPSKTIEQYLGDANIESYVRLSIA